MGSKHFAVGLDLEKLKLSGKASTDDQLTPPVTPLQAVSSIAAETDILDSKAESVAAGGAEGLLTFDGTLELGEEIGRGAWSTVSAACDKSPRAAISQQPLTPPASPASAVKAISCYAVKVPLHSLAYPVIRNEALILSQLTRCPQSASHVVPFHGFNPATNAIVLSRCSETLSNFASNALRVERSSPIVRPSPDPVIGLQCWLDIAIQLARGLSWMHELGVVHGDVKASNILLVRSTTGLDLQLEQAPLKALYCDFSSARLISNPPDSASSALPTDAITTSYASPELLKAYSRSYSSSPDSSDPAVATETSDIWALAVTLVVAAVGEDPYVHAGHEMRKLAMAKEGLVLDGVGMGDWRSGVKVRRGGVVERATRAALAKRVEARVGVASWIESLKEIKREVESSVGATKV